MDDGLNTLDGASLHHDAPVSPFDAALLRAAFDRAGSEGWHRFSLVDAALDAKLPIDEVRARFPIKAKLLITLCQIADKSALRDESEGAVKERLFDLLMRRLDVLQEYRSGVQAVMQAIPYDPALGALLAALTLDSMRWITETAGIDGAGIRGAFRIKAIAGIWALSLNTWHKDESADLGTTMAALEKNLEKAERFGALQPSPRQKLHDALNHSSLPNHDLEVEY
ncbi:TetR family transcriptional regulator [Neokomagataea thailandica NBRC 106555]|uniref:TetR family transcriptional regulator n=2 Tax=Neokomagataea TaxID=1223423 RepID=A0A4Y6V3Y2_9PROT|nr:MULTISPECIES: TetR family transcriptional regulator [Neokomagataea]QDH24653.1 TetR family transcriptional regulator [Neokomagataea tanensis]GBR53932.1 TetR family transcriptional regulator [Neokomagataea thailandica NBRC 106555]